MRVIVLGATGMLGSMTAWALAEAPQLAVEGAVRDAESAALLARWAPRVRPRTFDAAAGSDADLARLLDGAAWAVNAIGVIKPYIRDDRREEVERAVLVNALFPQRLARAAEAAGCRVLQIATDCVFSGAAGGRRETDAHDPLDVYGKTKSLGEVRAPGMHHLRCSIIGPELRGRVSLLEWFLRQPAGARLNGFTNHQWNGVPTLHFGRLCRGVIEQGLELPHLHHVVPGDAVSKADLLESFRRAFDRTDIEIARVEASAAADRTLATTDPELNQRLWSAAGFSTPPSIDDMVRELAAVSGRRASS